MGSYSLLKNVYTCRPFIMVQKTGEVRSNFIGSVDSFPFQRCMVFTLKCCIVPNTEEKQIKSLSSGLPPGIAWIS